MSMFQWREEYRIGHCTIDAQHQRLFELADRLHAAMAKGSGTAEMVRTLADLIYYTKAHFADEERIMQQSAYPAYAEHKREHDALTAKVVEFQKNFATATASTTLEVMRFLKEWLTHHIAGTDRKIAVHLAAVR